MTDTGTVDFKPPYMSFQTFWNFIGELGNKPLPPAIDRSMMSSKSGTDQANLTAALTTFGLMDTAGNVSDRLKQLVSADEAGRKHALAQMLQEFYPGPVAISESNATEAALHESFKDNYNLTAAETRRKCETFFLHALRVAGLPVSPHFKQTRAGSGAPGAPKVKKVAPRKRADASAPNGASPTRTTTSPQGSGETVTIDLGDAGKVVVSVDVRWLQLSQENFLALRKAVSDLEALAAANAKGATGPEAT